MRFSRTRRIFGLLSGAWLVVILAEPAKLHVCAVHTNGMVHTPSSHSGTQHSPRHEHSPQCSCIGASSHASPIVVPSSKEIGFFEAIVAVEERPTTADTAPALPAPFTLPYSNGPPRAIAA